MEQHEIRQAALRGLVPAALTVVVLVAGAVGARAGSGLPALAVALVAACAITGALALVLRVGSFARRRRAASPRLADDLGAEWSRVEPRWSGRG